MVKVKEYHLPATALIPNSPYPLIHYPGVLSDQVGDTSKSLPQIHELFASNGWQTQWIFRYGHTQESHYHSRTHECMAVLSGTATIRFGVADTDPDLEASTHGSAKESGGVEIEARAGDVFIIPAGVAHKTHDTTPADFALLTPGNGRGVDAENPKEALAAIELSGFTMMGAYPRNGNGWDYATGGENAGEYQKVWQVPRPELDPVLGDGQDGLCGLWRYTDMSGQPEGQTRSSDFYGKTTVDVDFLK